MPALRNRKDKLEKLAHELAEGKTAEEASRLAGYREGSSFGTNARKRAQRKDVKTRVQELKDPGIAAAERHIGINTEYVLTRSAAIVDTKVPKSKVKVSDQVAALNLIAKVIGAMAPEKHEVEGNGKIMIEWAPSSE